LEKKTLRVVSTTICYEVDDINRRRDRLTESGARVLGQRQKAQDRAHGKPVNLPAPQKGL